MILSVIAGMAMGAFAPPTADLAWHEYGPADQGPYGVPLRICGEISVVDGSDPSGNRRIPYTARDMPPGYSAPAGAYKPAFAPLYLGSDRQLVAVAAASTETGPIDRMWVDWNGDKRFDASEMATLVPDKDPSKPGSAVLEFKAPPKGAAGPIHVKMLLFNGVFVGMLPTGCMMGKIDLAGRTTEVAVVDMNFDGIYGNAGKDGPADTLFLDERSVELPALVQLADGKFWAPTIAPDGGRISFAQDSSPTGVVAFVGAPIESVSITSSNRNVVANAVDGKLTLPAGQCGINADFAIKEAGGKKWRYSIFCGGRFRVAAGSTTTFHVGGSLKLGVEVADSQGGRAFSLNLTDQGGSQVMGLYDEQGNRPPPARLTIIDPSGKVVRTMDFAYG